MPDDHRQNQPEFELLLPRGAEELRASFGDRKLPDISRKITACVSCRKLKIKCHMPDSSAPCVRCRKRGLSCTVNKSLQMLLEDDASWKQFVTLKIQSLEATVENLLQRQPIKSLQEAAGQEHHKLGNGQGSFNQDTTGCASERNRLRPSCSVETEQPNCGFTMDVDSGPATIPSLSINEMDVKQGTGSSSTQGTVLAGDIITEGLLTFQQAEALFDIYAQRLDHYLYRILGLSVTLPGIRSSSAALLAAICSVASLHSPELAFLYDSCYQRFRLLAMELAIVKDPNLDDIRALCIGAFWLHDMSWNFSCLAVRITTQKHHHRSFKNACKGNEISLAQARLYYLVYVCDHHFSIIYGRPPLMRECDAIHRVRDILSLQQNTEDNARLVSQVEIWAIASKILDTLGFDVDAPVPTSLITALRRFIIALDTWRADWNEQFGRHLHVGDYPRKGVKLHFHFLKLYLCSHAFRGFAPQREAKHCYKSSNGFTALRSTDNGNQISRSSINKEFDTAKITNINHAEPMHPDLEEIAMAAVHSAQSILRTTILDNEIQSHLNGLPLYFDTMIAFAIVFLFKVATKYSHVVRIDSVGTLGLISDTANVLRSVTLQMHRSHLLVAVANAVDRLCHRQNEKNGHRDPHLPTTVLDSSAENGRRSASSEEAAGLSGVVGSQDATVGVGWDHTAMVEFDWLSFDFLASEDTVTQHQGLHSFNTAFTQGW